MEQSNQPPAERFAIAYDSWRAGDEASLASVRAIADEMCRDLGRCEVPRIVEHYSALSREERAAGMALERRVLELRSQVAQAHEQGLRGEEWALARVPIEAAIESAWHESRALADRGARAKASALRAEYFVATLEELNGAALAAAERERLALQIERDASEAVGDFEAFSIVRASLNPRWSLARIDHFLGRLGSARAAYEALAEGARTVGETELVAGAFEGMLAIAKDRGDVIEGDRCLEALAGVRDAAADWPLARAWAMRLIHADRAGEARAFLDRFRAPDPDSDHPEDVDTRRELAYVRALALLRLGQLELAREQAATASATQGAGFDQRFLEARIELASGRAESAIAAIADPRLLASLGPRDEGAARTLLGEARLELGDPRGARAELERALELAEEAREHALAEPLLTLDDARRFNFIGEWEGAGLESVALLTRAHLAGGDALAAALASEDWQSRSLRGDDGELARLRARAGQMAQREPLTREQLKSWAGTAELGLVTWIFGADSGAVVHVKLGSDGELDCRGEAVGFGREVLREAVRRLRERAIGGLETRGMAREIGSALLPESVRAHIGRPRSDTDRLLFLLHGPLEALPIELLGLGEARFDEELCALALPGLPAAQPGPRPDAPAFQRWRLLGSPVDGADSDARPIVLLPGAGAELAELAKLHPNATLAQGAQFRRPALEAALLSNDCLHIATHLEVKTGESRSRFPAAGLRLDDGEVCSAREISDLSPAVPLVVLSACESGGGRYADGEGLFGVARAFLEGGTRNLVVTLWPVEDGAARDFSIAFHRALAAGEAPSRATRTARSSLVAQGRPSADWAAFRFLGRD